MSSGMTNVRGVFGLRFGKIGLKNGTWASFTAFLQKIEEISIQI
jgi:hypothetical protein